MSTATQIPQQVLQQAAILAWTTGLGAVTAEALAEREQLSRAVAQERLDEAFRSGFMDRHSLVVGYPALYTVTLAGRRIAREYADAGEYVYPYGLNKARVNLRDFRHTIACAGVTAALERRYPDHRVIGERELRRDEHEQGQRLASMEIRAAGRRRSHFPDLVIWPPAMPGERAPLPVAVEVELKNTRTEELSENCRAWARCSYVEAVLYFAETRDAERRLLEIVEQCKAEETIVVKHLSEMLEPLPGFGRDDY